MQKLLVLVVSGRDDGDLVKASAGAVLARVFVQNSAFFARFTSQPSLSLALQQSGVAVSDQGALFLFFDAWLDKVTIVMWFYVASILLFLLLSFFFYILVHKLGGLWQIRHGSVFSHCQFSSILNTARPCHNGETLVHRWIP
jgi:hypothetical protein